MSLEKYIVGGWVRDKLLTELGHPIQSNDKDWVVTGATPEEMLRLNFVPVGNDFPVFLHPKTHEEYALARTERKSGHGYKGFTFFADPSVTLEQDLLRRDLTVNAMAMDEEGHLIDPYGGFEDLKKGVLRHVSAAFEEDPLRVLRVSRFRAKLPWFRIAEETKAMLKRMVESGEVDALVPERVTAEIRKALKEANPRFSLTNSRRTVLWAASIPNGSKRSFPAACLTAFHPALRKKKNLRHLSLPSIQINFRPYWRHSECLRS